MASDESQVLFEYMLPEKPENVDHTQGKEHSNASTYFRTSSTSSVNSSICSDVNRSFSVIFEDHLDEDVYPICCDRNSVPNADVVMDDYTSNNSLVHDRKGFLGKFYSKDRGLLPDANPNISDNLKEDKIAPFFHTLHKQCLLSGATSLPSHEFPGTAKCPKVAVKVIKLLKDEVKEKTQQRDSLREEQAVMLKKLIKLLKVSSLNNRNKKERSCLSSQGLDHSKKANSKQMKKFTFLGFRSSKPVYKDRFGRLTAEKLFGRSRSSSPIRVAGDVQDLASSESQQDLSELEFVFKPSGTTLEALSHQIRVRKPVEETKLMQEEGVVATVIPTGNEKKGALNCKTPHRNHINGKSKQKGRSRRGKSLKHVWSSSLAKKRRAKAAHVQKPQVIREESMTTREKDISSLGDDHSTTDNKPVTKRQASSLLAKCLKDESKTQSLRKAANNESRISSRGDTVPPQTKGRSDPSQEATFTQEATARSAYENFGSEITSPRKSPKKLKKTSVLKRKFNVSEKKKNGKSVLHNTVSQMASTNGFSTLSTKNLNSVNKNLRHSTSSQFPFVDSSNWSKCQILNSAPVHEGLLRKQSESHCPKRPELRRMMFYPVHPYMSSDLPVHFIPVDPEKIPDYFPLYSPTFRKKSSAPLFPSFVQIRGAGCPVTSRGAFTFTNGIRSGNLPHQTLPAADVLPRVFPGILANSECPLVPDANSCKPAPTNTSNTNKLNSQTTANTVVSKSSVKCAPKAHRRPAGPAQDRSASSNGHGQAYTKMHKCPKCPFESPKLGVLKRHQLSHSQVDSYPLLPSDEVHILDFDENKTFNNTGCVDKKSFNNTGCVNKKPFNNTGCVEKKPFNNTACVDQKAKLQSQSFNEGLYKTGLNRESPVILKNHFLGFPESPKISLFDKKFTSISITPVYDIRD